ncbi:MAG: branched-chain amino acid transaminase [Trueperaceae bacterium]
MTTPSTQSSSGASAAGADQIWLDGKLVPAAEAKVSVLTHALHYGTSVFEGIRVYKTERGPAVFRLHEHARRLLDSARILLMRSPVSVNEIEDAILQTVRANGLQSGYVRPLLWYGADSLGINPGNNRVHFMVATMPWGSYLGDEVVRQGAKLMTSSWRRSPGDVMPTKSKAGGNYINSVLANQEARDNGFDEALLLDKQGFVAEGSGENVFFFLGNVLHPVAHSVNLRGITRDSVIRIAQSMGYEIVPTMATRDELYIADEIFLVGTAAEVTPVASLDRRPIGTGRAGERTLAIRQRYLDVVTGKVPEFDDWLAYVNRK